MFKRSLLGWAGVGGAPFGEVLQGHVHFVRCVLAISVLVLGGAQSVMGGGDTLTSPPTADPKPGAGGAKRGPGGAGTLDPTFGVGGRVVVPFDLGGSLIDRGTGIDVMDDGRIVVGGYAEFSSPDIDFAALRLLSADGALDPSFGIGGRITVPFDLGGELSDTVWGVTLQPDGKTILVGRAKRTAGSTIGGVLALARLGTDGIPDPTFGVDGRVTVDFDSTVYDDAWGLAVAVQPDGAIVAVGEIYQGSHADWAIVRVEEDGDLDPTFGTEGRVILHFHLATPSEAAPTAVVVRPDGRIVVAGWVRTSLTTFDWAIAQLLPDGSLDPSFREGGKFTLDQGGAQDGAQGIAMQGDKIVVVGYTSDVLGTNLDFAVHRFLSDGTDDGGITVGFDLGGAMEDIAFAVAVQTDGGIVVAGFAEFSNEDTDMAVLRLNRDLSLDHSFGTAGRATVYFDLGGDLNDIARSISIQSDGKIVVAGSARTAVGSDFAVFRMESGLVFADGFESGDTSLWSVTVQPL